MVAVLTTAALWGASAPLVKQLVDVFPPCTLAALRLAIALMVLVPVLLIQGKRPRIGRSSILLGLSGVAAANLLQNFGMERMPAGSATVVLLGGTVLLTTLLGWIRLGEHCSTPVMLAMSGCGLGIVLVALSGGGAALAFPIVGLLLILGSALAWAIYAVVGRSETDGDPIEMTTGALLVGLIALAPFVAWERPDPRAMSIGAGDLLALLVLGSLVTAGSYLCWGYGIRHLQANEASVLCSVEPAFGLVFAWLLLKEGISMQAAVGAAIIVASCVLVARGDSSAPVGPQDSAFPALVEAV